MRGRVALAVGALAVGALAVGALAVMVALRWARPWAEPPGEAGLAWGVCGGAVHHAEAVVTGTLRLHAELLGEPTAERLREAVALQLRYAFGSQHNDVSARSLLAPDGPPYAVEIVEQMADVYGQDIVLDWPADPALHVESAYVRRALARGRLAADDPALVVTWRAQVRLSRCDRAQQSLEFHLPVPHDPYMLYWSVAAGDRVEQEYLDRRVRTFPCADSQIADYAHPEYLWYFWRPNHADCDERGLGSVALTITRQTAPGGDLSRWRRGLVDALAARPLRIVVVFGFLNHQVARPAASEVRAALADREPLAPAVAAEWGSVQYVEFVRGLDELLVEPIPRVFTQDGDLAAEITGVLRGSGRRVEIVAHLTETDYLAPPAYAPRHPPLLLAGLRDADAILYAGHSGLGLNFSLAQLEQDAPPGAVTAALAASPVRLLGFIGCYTYSYFGDDLALRLPRAREDALFVYTGNAVVQTADSVLYVLRTLDCLLARGGEIGPGVCDLPAPGPKDSPDFVLYELGR